MPSQSTTSPLQCHTECSRGNHASGACSGESSSSSSNSSGNDRTQAIGGCAQASASGGSESKGAQRHAAVANVAQRLAMLRARSRQEAERSAAVRLQAAWRGHLTRCRFQRMMHRAARSTSSGQSSSDGQWRSSGGFTQPRPKQTPREHASVAEQKPSSQQSRHPSLQREQEPKQPCHPPPSELVAPLPPEPAPVRAPSSARPLSNKAPARAQSQTFTPTAAHRRLNISELLQKQDNAPNERAVSARRSARRSGVGLPQLSPRDSASRPRSTSTPAEPTGRAPVPAPPLSARGSSRGSSRSATPQPTPRGPSSGRTPAGRTKLPEVSPRPNPS